MWTNRVKLFLGREARWVTAAIDRSTHGSRQIREVDFARGHPWRKKLIKSLHSNYGRHPYFLETMRFFGDLIINEEANIAKYNLTAIKAVARKLEINTEKISCSSSFGFHSSSNELLCDLANAVGCDTYLAGGGANAYQDGAVFREHGIHLVFQEFKHPHYHQYKQKEFTSGLSIIDAVMNLGWAGVSNLLRGTS